MSLKIPASRKGLVRIMSYVTYFRKWIVSYVTYLENDYVVCDIIRVTATDVSDIHVGKKTVFT